MAILDASTNEIVIRVVYDGAPESGKTTSLRALAGSLAQSAVTPEEDATGRTLWFDWMEYVGGRFEGARIRCQIVSVPGQRELDVRRKTLLASADAVVSVIDSTPDAFDRSASYVRELRALVQGSTVGVVLQANKRDRADALPLAEMRAALGTPAIVESVAADGTGIREAFVYAVRVALDRVRDLMGRGVMPTGEPAQGSAAELLALLRGVEAKADDVPALATNDASLAAEALAAVLDEELDAMTRPDGKPASPNHVPLPPDATVPSGAVWPPVEGRAIMAQVAEHELSPHRFGNGDWVVGLGSGWRIVSRRDACFRSLDEGRSALIQWARLHAASATAISSRRCIVLADAGDGSWRLWQVVRVEESLREQLSRAVDEGTPEQALHRLVQGGKHLLEAMARIAGTPCDLACTLDSIGSSNDGPVYVGLMPSVLTEETRTIVMPATLLRSQLEPVVAVARIGERGAALQHAIETVPRPLVDRDGIMSTLVSLFA